MPLRASTSVLSGVARFVGYTIICSLSLQRSFAGASPQTLTTNGTEPNMFTWNKIVPSADLVWHNCYSGLQCARLSVPLNYSDPNGSKAAIAITRVQAAVPVDSPHYRGPILLNPGGPGGSGVDFVIEAGNFLATVVGPQFDVLSFDPRGIARSTPRVSFLQPIERALWGALGGPVQVLNTTIEGIARPWARAKVTNTLAGARQFDLLRHINTDQTARDMLRIVQAHGREKLQYWGFSYGSVLGSTFAAMFPDKVERLIIDGVVDVENYYETLWSNNLLDSNKTMQYFYDSCHSAGPQACPFYAPSPQQIARNLTSLYAALRKRPIPVQREGSYGLADYNAVRLTVLTSLYSPFGTFFNLSRILTDLAEGKGERLFDYLGSSVPPGNLDCNPSNDDPDSLVLSFADALSAVACNDGTEVSTKFEDFEKYFKEMTEESEWGEMWSGIRASCIGWPKIPKTHFRGPITGNTSFPMLLIGNTADPVTPLWAAKKVSKGFPGSVVLTIDGAGHSSINVGPSPCAMQHIRNYFVNGTLPIPDTVCPVLGSPFAPPPLSSSQTRGEELKAEDRELLDASLSFLLTHRIGPIPLRA